MAASERDKTAFLRNKCLAADNWSLYPAKQEVDMSCYDMKDLGGITFCDSGVVFSDGGDALDISGTVIFARPPQTPVAPTAGDDLANKTYVDSIAVGGSEMWSTHPAIHEVDICCNRIVDVSGITFCDGTYVGPGGSFDISSGQDIKVTTDTHKSIILQAPFNYYDTALETDVSGTNTLVLGESSILGTPTGFGVHVDGTVDISNNADISIRTYNPTGLVNIKTNGGGLLINDYGSTGNIAVLNTLRGSLSINDSDPSFNQIALGSTTNKINITSDNTTPNNSNITLNSSGGINLTSAKNITLTPTTAGKSVVINGSEAGSHPAALTFNDSLGGGISSIINYYPTHGGLEATRYIQTSTAPYPITLYVSKSGNDSWGTGSQSNPFLTIQKAIDIAAPLWPSGQTYNPALVPTIFIDSGTYDESLTIKRPVNIIGLIPYGSDNISVPNTYNSNNNVIIGSSTLARYIYFNSNPSSEVPPIVLPQNYVRLENLTIKAIVSNVYNPVNGYSVTPSIPTTVLINRCNIIKPSHVDIANKPVISILGIATSVSSVFMSNTVATGTLGTTTLSDAAFNFPNSIIYLQGCKFTGSTGSTFNSLFNPGLVYFNNEFTSIGCEFRYNVITGTVTNQPVFSFYNSGSPALLTTNVPIRFSDTYVGLTYATTKTAGADLIRINVANSGGNIAPTLYLDNCYFEYVAAIATNYVVNNVGALGITLIHQRPSVMSTVTSNSVYNGTFTQTAANSGTNIAINTFSAVPSCSGVPTTANHLTNKTYVDLRGALAGTNTWTAANTFGNGTLATSLICASGCAVTYNAGSTFTSNALSNQFTTNTTFGNGSSALSLTCASGCTITMNPNSTFISNSLATFNSTFQLTSALATLTYVPSPTPPVANITYDCASNSIATKLVTFAGLLSTISFTAARAGGQYTLIITASGLCTIAATGLAVPTAVPLLTIKTNYTSPISIASGGKAVMSILCETSTSFLISCSVFA